MTKFKTFDQAYAYVSKIGTKVRSSELRKAAVRADFYGSKMCFVDFGFVGTFIVSFSKFERFLSKFGKKTMKLYTSYMGLIEGACIVSNQGNPPTVELVHWSGTKV